MPSSYKELSEMSNDDLIAGFDRQIEHVPLVVGFIRDELHRRDMQAASDRMEAMTDTIKRLTAFVAILTTISAVASVCALIRW